jgi:hypothetical protein
MVEPGNGSGQPADEQAELERLRAEVASLHEQVEHNTAAISTAKVRRPGGWRPWVAGLCIVVAGILVPLSVASVWARSQVTDTNRYVDTVTPLASDPGVQAAVTTQISNQVFTYINVDDLANQVFSRLGDRGILPPVLTDQLKALEVPIVNGIKGFITTEIAKFVASPEFATAWSQANRVAHEQLVATLTGEGPSGVSIANGKVSVNLATVINAVKAKLVASGFGLASNIPDVNATFTIFSSPDIGKVQTGYNLLNKIGVWLPIIALILLALGVYIARSHRKALMWAGITVFVSAGLLAIGLALGRTAYLNAVTGDVLPRDVAASIFDTVVRFLRDGIRSTALIGLIVAVAAFLVGPSVTATRTRELCTHGAAATRTGIERLGLHLAPVTAWVAPRARLLRIISCVAAFVVLFFWPYRTPGVVFWLAVALLVVMFVIQVLATQPRESGTAAAEPAPVTA